MRRTRVLGLTAAALVTTLALSGCADDSADDGSAATPDNTPTESETASEGGQPVEPTTSAPTESEPEPADDAVEVDVTIQDGEISPLGKTVEADPGQQIRLVVDSDTHDEFHVHSDPEHEFVIQEGAGQIFTFTLDDPAVYEMESHELGVVIVKFQIS
jgi:hypothetical protein